MAGNLAKTPPKYSDDQTMERMLVWAACGISESWIKQHLIPACSHCICPMNQSEGHESVKSLERGGGDWDILFLGSHGGKHDGPGALEALVGKVSIARALDFVVAVCAAPSPERQVALLRAGAADVISTDAGAEQIAQSLEHLIRQAQARRTQMEQDKLRLINQLAISVNHEVNNPLTGLMGTAELLLLENQDLSSKVRHDIQTIIKQCYRIQEVTNRLKTLNHLRTIPYGAHDQMIDLIGKLEPGPTSALGNLTPIEQFLPTPRILVVDDNPLIIDLIARLFDQRFVIDAAGCASEALRKIEQKHYDLILTDLILPEMNGLELFRAVRRHRPRQKILLTTAYEGDARVDQAITEGALGCIAKPFRIEELETALTEAIQPQK